MSKLRLGRQTPTRSLILPYTKTSGKEAVDLYAKTGRQAQEWQELLLYDILAENDAGLWTHSKFGYSVPRRNGKNEIVAIREMYGLMRGEMILHTAHRTTTSHMAWERLCSLLDKAKIEYKSIRASGRERIDVECTGGRAEFRTRSTKGGLGEGFDLLIIDEAQEYTEDQENALKYVVSDSRNPQTILCGTPPTPVSSGTVFMKLRSAALAGETQNTGWAEWSVPAQRDPHDVNAWYETNPSMGSILNERKIVPHGVARADTGRVKLRTPRHRHIRRLRVPSAAGRNRDCPAGKCRVGGLGVRRGKGTQTATNQLLTGIR